MKRFFSDVYHLVSRKFQFSQALNRFLALLPIQKNKIVFSNFHGRGYGCDPKYICEELRKRNLGLKLVWLVSDPSKGREAWDLPADVRMVKFGSRQARYEIATARIWVFNTKGFEKPPKKHGQFYIQTWHSSLGLKMVEKDAPTLPKEYVKASKQDAKITDLMYANNDFRYEIYRNHFWYQGPIIKCSVPRCSVLFSTPESIKEKVRKAFSLSKDQKIILYVPTFRSSHSTEVYRFDYRKCLESLKAVYQAPFVFLLRLHPNLASADSGFPYGETIKNATHYPDVQELLAVSDVVITDYSGCMFDAAFAQKPVFLYVPDVASYLKNDRNLYFRLDQLPFSAAVTSDELCENILRFSPEQYKSRCGKFFEKIGLEEDGSGSRILADLILSEIKGESWNEPRRKNPKSC